MAFDIVRNTEFLVVPIFAMLLRFFHDQPKEFQQENILAKIFAAKIYSTSEIGHFRYIKILTWLRGLG